jgi:hypothetical protein
MTGMITVTKPANKLEIPVMHVTEVMIMTVLPFPISLGVKVGALLLVLVISALAPTKEPRADVDAIRFSAAVPSFGAVNADAGTVNVDSLSSMRSVDDCDMFETFASSR